MIKDSKNLARVMREQEGVLSVLVLAEVAHPLDGSERRILFGRHFRVMERNRFGFEGCVGSCKGTYTLQGD